jgi:hypothetical protein
MARTFLFSGKKKPREIFCLKFYVSKNFRKFIYKLRNIWLTAKPDPTRYFGLQEGEGEGREEGKRKRRAESKERRGKRGEDKRKEGRRKRKREEN